MAEPGGVPAVFLDRDGVLNRPVVREGRPYPPASVADFELYADVFSGCARLKAAGLLLVVVTNQPDVGRGKQERAVVDAINQRLVEAVPFLDRVDVCFHAGIDWGEDCICRKPKPGMLYRSAKALGIDLGSSYMIGDRWQDVDCAKAAGCHSVFIERGYSESLRQQPDTTVFSFDDAVTAILEARTRALASSEQGR
jgi:D-glycero-D-manno-heptose 1,7-bisphosphate phosphatase